jgi:hypothetical protein
MSFRASAASRGIAIVPIEGSACYGRACKLRHATCFTQRRRGRQRRRGPPSGSRSLHQRTVALHPRPNSKDFAVGIQPLMAPRPCSVLRVSAAPRDQQFTRANGNGNGNSNSISRGAAETRSTALRIEIAARGHRSTPSIPPKNRNLGSAFSRSWRRGRYRLSSAPLQSSAPLRGTRCATEPLRETRCATEPRRGTRCATEPRREITLRDGARNPA